MFFLLQAYVLLGKFLNLGRDEITFSNWLQDETGASEQNAKAAYKCLRDWCDSYL